MGPWFRRGYFGVFGLLVVIFFSLQDYPSPKFTSTDCDNPSCPATHGTGGASRAYTRSEGSSRSGQGHPGTHRDPGWNKDKRQKIKVEGAFGEQPLRKTLEAIKEDPLREQHQAGETSNKSKRNVPQNVPQDPPLDSTNPTNTTRTANVLVGEHPDTQDFKRKTHYHICKIPESTPSSESIAQNIFFSEPAPACDQPQRHDICTILVLSATVTKVRCRGDLCHGNMSLGVLTPDTGRLQWEKLASAARLETKIASLIKRRAAPNVYQRFCFIRCNAFGEHLGETGRAISQLLVFPPAIDASADTSQKPPGLKPISINIIHIDSISRRHFHRSLPRTAAALQRLGRERNDLSRAIKVLDFRLLQTLKARTYESLRLLFTGQLPARVDLMSNPTDRDEEPSNSSIAFEQLLAPLKRNGFATLYLEDMCWESGWGLVRHLGVSRTNVGGGRKRKEVWGKLMSTINSSFIDDVGPSFSSCELLRAYGVSHPFHGPPAICANGRYQHDYAFDYLQLFQQTMRSLHTPSFSFLMSNVAHEPTGKRVQTLDQSLSKYLSSISNLDNHITIITADHGNSYGEYVQKTLQGRLEMFNPPLFILIPKSVSQSLDPSWMHSLEDNQNKLVTFLDLHLFQRQLANMTLKDKPVHTGPIKHQRYGTSEVELPPLPEVLGAAHSRQGLHEPLPISRTCDDLPMFVDTVCICDGHFTPAAPQPRYVLLAAFAVGQINNLIQQQSFKSTPSSNSTGCLPLTLYRVIDVWVRQQGEMTTARMNVMILPDRTSVKEKTNISLTPETWTLSVKWRPGAPTSNMSLTSVIRLSQYGHFRACAEQTVDVKFCLCALRNYFLEDDLRNGSENLTQRPLQEVASLSTSSAQQSPARSFPGNRYQTIMTPRKQSGKLQYSNTLRPIEGYYNGKGYRGTLRRTAVEGLTRREIIKIGFYLGAMEIHSIPGEGNACMQVLVRRNAMGAAFWARNLCSNKRQILLTFDVRNMDVSSVTSYTTVKPNQRVFLAICVQSSPNLNFYWKYKVKAT